MFKKYSDSIYQFFILKHVLQPHFMIESCASCPDAPCLLVSSVQKNNE